MNKDILKGRWNQVKGTLRSKWNKLTDDDVDQIQGEGEKFIGKLQERYGWERERAEREMNDFLNSGQPAGQTGTPMGGTQSQDEGDDRERKIS